MSTDSFKIKKGLNIDPNSISPSVKGDLCVDTTSGELRYHNGSSSSAVVTADHAEVLTQKDISGADNNITDVDASNVINTPSGNLAAVTVQGALNELQTDVDTRATSAALTTHEADTSTHGVNTVAGLSEAQVFTNKDIDGGTASNSNRITLPKNTKTNLDALNRKEGTIVYDTTGQKAYIDNGSTLVQIGSGSGGGINHIDNPDAETDTTGWATYADAAGTSPVDGTGGSANITWTKSTSNPLRGNASFLLTKGGTASRQGEGSSYTFSIDDADKCKIQTISFDYEVDSGTYADDDVRIFIYDVTNATLIEPTNHKLKNCSIENKHTCQFQATTSTSYRLIYHIASTSTADYTLKFDNIQVGPQNVAYGTPATDWTSYTPGWTASGVAPAIGNGTLAGQWRRVGDSMEVQVSLLIGAGTTLGSGVYYFALPTGYTMDAAKFPMGSVSGDHGPIGTGVATDTGTTNYYIGVLADSTTTVKMIRDTTLIQHNSPFAFNTGDRLSVSFKVPITGWSSNLALSSSSDEGRVVAGKVTGAGGAAQGITTTPGQINWTVVSKDTHGAFNSGTSTLTIPVEGFYRFVVGMEPYVASGATTLTLGFYVDNVMIERATESVSASYDAVGLYPFEKYLTAGQVVNFKVALGAGTMSLELGALSCHMSWSRVAGPQTIAASESINARYTTDAGQSIPHNAADAIINFEDVTFDSHGSVTTGAAWKFTAQASGLFNVLAAIRFASDNFTAGNLLVIYIYKNGSIYSRKFVQIQVTQAQTPELSIIDDVKLNAGDYVDVRVYQNGGGARLLYVDTNCNYVSIKRVGNY